MIFACPSCGAEVKFQSKISVFAVCAYCQSMLVRHDMDLQSLGKIAALQDDASPLQLGTRGKFQSDSFEVVGGLQLDWGDGRWSEWFITFADGKTGWLAEAQGFYAVSFALGSTEKANYDVKAMVPGAHVQIGKNAWVVDDVKRAECVGSLGELPFSGQVGRKSVSVDLSGSGQEFACIDFSDDGTSVYQGTYVPFDDLAFSNLRVIDGW